MLEACLYKRFRGNGIGAVLARGVSGAFMVGVIGALMAFGTNVLLARLMGVNQYGIYIYTLTWINLLAMVSRLGLNTSLLRFVPAYNAKGEWGLLRGVISRSVQYVLLTSLLIGMTTAIIIWFLQDRINMDQAMTFWIAIFLLPLLAVTGIRQAVLRAFKHIVKSGLPESFFRPLLLSMLVISMYMLSHQNIQATHVMVFNIIGAIAAFLIGSYWLFKALPENVRYAKPMYADREWLTISLPLFFMSGMALILNKTDIIMIGLILDAEQAGIYAIASRVAGLIVFGLTAMNTIVVPMISELYSTGQHKKLQKMITLAARGIGVFTLVMCISLAVLGKYMLGLFGEDFVIGYIPLLILIAGQTINALAGSVGFLMSMTGHQMQAAKIVGISALLNIIGNIILIPALGLMGAAIATALTTVIWNLVMLFYVIKYLKINPTIMARL